MSTIKNLPSVRTTSIIDFAKAKTLPPEISFTRGSTGTYFDEYGKLIIEDINVPRFVNDITTKESLGVLVEQSSTNYAPPLTLWTLPNGVTVAQDGDWEKCAVYLTGGSSRSISNTSVNLPNPTDASGLFTLSVEISRDMTLPKRIHILMGYNAYSGGYSGVDFNLDTMVGTIARSKTTELEPPMVIAYDIAETINGWFCTVTIRNDEPRVTSINNIQWGIYPGNVGSSTDVGYQKYRRVQIEQLPYATSFIPTTTTAPATRALDTFKIDFENNERSFILEFNQPLTNGTYGLFVSTIPATNVLVVYSQQYPNNNIGNTVNWRNVNINEPFRAALQSGNKTSRIAMVCAENEYRIYINGVRETFESASSNGVPEIIKSLVFNGGTDGGMNTTVFKRISSYRETLTDGEACRLTQVM